MLLYISVHHEFIKRVIAFRRFSQGLLKFAELALREKKNSARGFWFPPNLRILGTIFDKKQNNSLNQLIFKTLFLSVNGSDFSETFTRSNYML